ncbi:MAG TPA: LLM class F420-dependent oxidoreductase [Candidatus Tectomicrobia bacterium]|nr:LLM class F420-dependent oxidoreductase [Candidatus Tectomicrobia bacterium]
MKIGAFVFQTDDVLDPAVLARKAEELGFESFWVPEHPIIPLRTSSPYRGSRDGSIPESYGRIVDPFIALARASAATQTIKLGTAICLVPERNPLLLAKEIATLDRFSGGRFLFGIGAGWLKEETEIMGGDFPHRWTQAREAILAMKELWTKAEAEFHGKYYDFPPVRSFPKPAQQPHPPILVGGNAPNVLKRVVAWGSGWMPGRVSAEDIRHGCATLRELAEQAGRDPNSLEVMAFGSPGQFRDRASIKEMEAAGASRVTIWFTQTAGEALLGEMEELAGQVLPA